MACAAGLAGPLAVAPLLSESRSTRSRPCAANRPSWTCDPARCPIGLPAISPAPAGRPRRRSSRLRFERPLSIMTHQVSAADYQRCVDDAACRPLDRRRHSRGRSSRGAGQLARRRGLCRPGCRAGPASIIGCRPTRNGRSRRAANYRDDGLPVDDNDPSKRWIARYERESERADSRRRGRARSAVSAPTRTACSTRRAMSGNGPHTCFVRTALDDAGQPVSKNVELRRPRRRRAHRAYVTDFIRDARAGGCAVGVPPSNLGFRLVREPGSWIENLSSFFASRGRPHRPDRVVYSSARLADRSNVAPALLAERTPRCRPELSGYRHELRHGYLPTARRRMQRRGIMVSGAG